MNEVMDNACYGKEMGLSCLFSKQIHNAIYVPYLD